MDTAETKTATWNERAKLLNSAYAALCKLTDAEVKLLVMLRETDELITLKTPVPQL